MAADLSGLTVLEVGQTPATAFAGALLADFGARVVVVEPPPAGSTLRRLGGPDVQAVWWPILARNKLSLALDAAHDAAGTVLDRLAGRADLLVRDGDAPPWRDALARAGSGVLDLALSPPGADRPELWHGSLRPELAAAASGAMAMTGAADGPPCQPEMPLADYTAATLAAASALCELAAAGTRGAPPRPLAVGLHEALARMNEWQLVYATGRGFPERRNGNRFPLNANIGNVFRTRDGGLVTVSAATAAVADRLLLLVGGEAARADPRFSTQAARRAHMDALEELIGDWMARHDLDAVLRLGRESDVVIGPILDAGGIMASAHVQARGDVVVVERPGEDAIAMPGVVPRMSGVEARVRHAGPAVGQDTEAVLAWAGLDPDGIAALRRSGVVWNGERA